MKDTVLMLLLALSNSILLIFIVMLSTQNSRLKRDLQERSKWHEREIAKWRQRL